jgi:hypothetical protein
MDWIRAVVGVWVMGEGNGVTGLAMGSVSLAVGVMRQWDSWLLAVDWLGTDEGNGTE